MRGGRERAAQRDGSVKQAAGEAGCMHRFERRAMLAERDVRRPALALVERRATGRRLLHRGVLLVEVDIHEDDSFHGEEERDREEQAPFPPPGPRRQTNVWLNQKKSKNGGVT